MTNNHNNISSAQLEANRRNSKLGGVKTDKGKSISKMNATKHGLLSKQAILNFEDQSAYNNLMSSVYDFLEPEGAIEILLTDKLISNFWRLRRIVELEKMAVEHAYHEPLIGLSFGLTIEEQKAQENRCKYIKIIHVMNSEVLLKYESFFERGIFRLIEEIDKLQSVRKPSKLSLSLDSDETNKNGFVSQNGDNQ